MAIKVNWCGEDLQVENIWYFPLRRKTLLEFKPGLYELRRGPAHLITRYHPER